MDAQYEEAKTMKVSLENLMDDTSKGNKFMTRQWASMKPSCLSQNDNPSTGVSKKRLTELIKTSVIIKIPTIFIILTFLILLGSSSE